MSITDNTLTIDHLQTLIRFRIPEEFLQDAGVCSGDDYEVRQLLGLTNGFLAGENLSGIVFPYTNAKRQRIAARIRLDEPTSTGAKYLSELGSTHLYFPPPTWAAINDPSVDLIVVEGEKSALALTALAARTKRKWVTLALGGCYGWRRRRGKKPNPDGSSEPLTGPAADLDLIDWTGRRVLLAFDANAATNDDVKAARGGLKRELTKRGAVVAFVVIPIQSMNGPDDLIAEFGDQAMVDAIDATATTEVIIGAGRIPEAADKAEEVLVRNAERLGIFQRAGEIVKVTSLPAPLVNAGVTRPTGTTILRTVITPTMLETLERLIQFEKITTKRPVRIDCPSRLATYYLARGEWKLPPLTGVITAPIVLPDGSILSKPGYDRSSGLFLVRDGTTWYEPKQSPTLSDAQDAIAVLLKPFSEFPFVTPADLSAHIAAILTAIQRKVLPACPMFAYSAPQQRNGKSLLASAVGIIATGRPASAATVSRDTEEFRKALTSSLREGLGIVCLDNIEHPLVSPDLAKILTESEFADRVLGESRILRLPTDVTWLATGNNLELRGDLAVRSLLCRIDAQQERPEQRRFNIPDLKSHLTASRPALVDAVLTIIRAYYLAGEPKQDIPEYGGFEGWSAIIRGAIVWCGLADPFLTREHILSGDLEAETSAELLETLYQYFGDDHFTINKLIEQSNDRDCRQLRDALMSVAGGRNGVENRLLGWWCRKTRDRVIFNYRLRRVNNYKPAAWKVDQIDAC